MRKPSITGPAFYVGAHGGYRWADANVSSGNYSFSGGNDVYLLPGLNGSVGLDGGIFGPHVGFNYQAGPNWLIGIEGDLDFGSEKSSIANAFNGIADDGDGFTFRSNADIELTWQGTIRGRFGYVVNNWLWYATAGVAFTKVKYNSSWSLVHEAGDFAGSNSSSASKTLTGWVVGTGVEHMFLPNWTIRVEYLAEGFNDFTVPQGIAQTGSLDLDTVHKVRIGITFKN